MIPLLAVSCFLRAVIGVGFKSIAFVLCSQFEFEVDSFSLRFCAPLYAVLRKILDSYIYERIMLFNFSLCILGAHLKTFYLNFIGKGVTPWPCRIKVFGEQWVNQWCRVSQGLTKVN